MQGKKNLPRKTAKSSMDVAIDVVGGKWKLLIVHILLKGSLRTNEILKLLPGASERILIKQLREMERDQLVSRKVFPEVPPKVTYSLTDHGVSLKPMIEVLGKWGYDHVKKVYKQKGIAYEIVSIK